MKLRTYFSIIAIAALAFSCTKQGPTGPTGPAGASANVAVQTYTVAPGVWRYNGNGGWNCDLAPASNINPTQGAVSILFSYNDVKWMGLPYIGNTVGDVDINYTVTTDSIQIQYLPQTNAGSIGAPTNTVYVQVSLLPQSIMVKYPNINWQNAIQVSQLPEVQAASKK